MMKAVRLIVPNNGMFHIGKNSLAESNTMINSDTLFSAICNNIRSLYGVKKLDELKNYLINEFLISSIFHFLDVSLKNGNEPKLIDTIYFFPKPLKTPKIEKVDEKYFVEQIKNWKKIQFISKDVLENIAEGKAINFNSNLILDNKYLISEKDFKLLMLEKFPDSILEIVKGRISFTQNITEQKVLISRLNYESKDTFYQGNLLFNESTFHIFDNKTKERIYYNLKPGMFFLIKNETIPKEILAAIRIITDNGLGGKRTTGKGLFDECQIIEFNLSINCESNSEKDNMTLSIVIPKKEEISSLAKYTLTTKRGFIFSKENRSLRKRSITVINEGSIFNSKIEGKVVDVSPKETEIHEIFRYGKAFLIPIEKS